MSEKELSPTLPFAEALSSALAKRVREILEAIGEEAEHRVYAVCNQKGGAGKTTTLVTVCAVWASWGLRVRIIDADPSKGSATWWLNPVYTDEHSTRWTLREVFLGECTLDEATYPTQVPGLYIVPSDKSLEEIERAALPGLDMRLKKAISKSTRPFDRTVIDTRPSLSILTTTAMVAANELWFALNGAALDSAGLSELAEHRDEVRDYLNADLRTTGALICRYRRTRIAGDILNKLRASYPDAVVETIPQGVRMEEAPAAHQPPTIYAPREKSTHAYVLFAAKVLTREADQKAKELANV